MKTILINADDFGLNSSCTEAICEAFDKKLITDTTLVANGEAFQEALDAIEQYDLHRKIGIHFNLTEGVPLTEEIRKFDSFANNGCFHGKVNRIRPLSKAEKKAVYEELTAQAKRLKAAGVNISHADSHHHIHTGLFIAPIAVRVCKEQKIKKIRLHRNIGSISFPKRIIKKLFNVWIALKGFKTVKYFGSMEDVELTGIMDNLEIMVHPEYNARGELIDKTDVETGVAAGPFLKRLDGNYKLKGYSEL